MISDAGLALVVICCSYCSYKESKEVTIHHLITVCCRYIFPYSCTKSYILQECILLYRYIYWIPLFLHNKTVESIKRHVS